MLYTSKNSFTAMLVAQDSAIKTARDLNGKTVGSVSLGDNTAASILAWIDQNGGDSRSVRIIEISPSVAPPALAEGRVSAVVLNEPSVSQAIATGKARLFAHPQDAIAPRFQAAAYAVMAPVAERNADAMKRFALAMHEAALYTNAHPAQTVGLVAAYSGVSATDIAHSVRMVDQEYVEVPYIQPVIDVLAKYGMLDKAFPAQDVISPSALRAGSRSNSQT